MLSKNQEEAKKTRMALKHQIALKKAELARTDYKCLKYVDGALTEEEYATVKAQRQSLREEINSLESRIQ